MSRLLFDFIVDMSLIVVLGVAIYIVRDIILRSLAIREKETKNDLYKMYSEIDPDSVESAIDNMIDAKLAEYIFVNIKTRDNTYMNTEDIDKMLKVVSAYIYSKMSELYLFYIRLLVNIDTDDDLIIYINEKVKLRAVSFVQETNKLQ